MNPSGIFASTGGRRFVLALLVTVLSFICVWFGKIDGAILRDIILGVVAVYVAGNVIQKVKAPAAEADA